MILFTLLFLIYAWALLFYVCCKIFSLFTQHLRFKGYVLTSPIVIHELLHRGARKEQETSYSTDHNRTMLDVTDRGRPVTAVSSFSLSCVVEINFNFL